MIRITIPAGRYILGDPCYAIRDDDWSFYLEAAGWLEERLPEGIFVLFKGAPVLSFRTAHGDGEFTGSDGRNYGVDAGLIGLVHESIGSISVENSQRVVEFLEPTVCVRDEGTLRFGNIVIETGYVDEDEDGDEEFLDEDFEGE